jgi:hypothetical protein
MNHSYWSDSTLVRRRLTSEQHTELNSFYFAPIIFFVTVEPWLVLKSKETNCFGILG